MPVLDYGYMEGQDLGRPYDWRLVRRLARYARPQLGLLLLAACIILCHTGLDLLLPYLTRSAIDRYMVRQVLALDTSRLDPGLRRELGRRAPGALAGKEGRYLYLPEKSWRGLGSSLTSRLRAAGALDSRSWYPAPPGKVSRELAQRHPGLFRRAGDRLLIAVADLKRLDQKELEGLRRPDAWGLVGLAGLFLLAALGAGLLGFIQQVMLEKAGQETIFSIRQDLYRRVLERSLDFFQENPVGKLVTRLTNDVANLNEMYRSTIVAFCQDLFLVLGIVVVLLLLDHRLALICFSLAPVIAALAWAFSRLARSAFRDLQGYQGRLNSRISETLGGLATVKLLRAQAESRREFTRLNQAHLAAGLRQVKVFALFMPLTELFSSLAVALIIWYGGGQAVADRLSLGTLVAFIFYMQMFFRPVRDMAEKYNIMQAAMASAERIFQLMDQGGSLPRPSRPRRLSPDTPGRVEYREVSFGYDPRRPVVRQVSFAIPSGQSWALVGPTGAGKTSLVNLLPRFYDPQAGRVLIDGVDVRELEPEQLARLVAVVPQEVFLFAGTVEENITLDRPWITAESLARALEVTGADQWVAGLPEGLQTRLGEGARRLSEGQRQLLALARALAGRPRVLVLDEATSNVDPHSEHLIQQALPRVMAGRTSLVVAHRLSTVRRAHHILVMRRGRVVESGRHRQLMAADGLYARLVRLQGLRG